jgi:hypothetical protein
MASYVDAAYLIFCKSLMTTSLCLRAVRGVHLNKQLLIEAISRSGGKQSALEEVDDLWARLYFLYQTGRYGLLLSQLFKANDKSNFLALALEANFAYQYEAKGLQLIYEVKQCDKSKSSIDFLRKVPSGESIYFELRLLQQTESSSNSINAQLQECQMYNASMGEKKEHAEIVRIQATILSKVQDKCGNPIKFFSTAVDSVNIVVIDATDSILGQIDIHDCRLAMYGDPSVNEVNRRQIFGLFQADKAVYPQHIHNLATKYAHIRNTLHGVMFLFKRPGTGTLAYQLEQYMMWNPDRVDSARVHSICIDVASAIPNR